MSHTPGPWKVEPCSSGGLILVRGEPKPGAPYQHMLQIVPEADARLIAAAPDLLEACRIAMTMLEEAQRVIEGGKLPGEPNMFRFIRAAIAKAEGTLP